MKNKLIIGLMILTVILGCAKKEATNSKSMDEIYQTEGIPVKVKEITAV